MLNNDLIESARHKLYSAVISDVLDSCGNLDHAMAPNIRPLDDTLVMFGRARTGLYMEVYEHDPDINPYELEIALVDSLQPNDVAVLACPSGNRIAPWGELLSTTAKVRGAAGCVTDGLVRDLRFIRQMNFPVFAGGIGPLDSKGRGMIMQTDIVVECGGVTVRPNDWIFGDIDGVVVIPGNLVEKVLDLALEKVNAENTVRQELEAGESLATVFARHRIL